MISPKSSLHQLAELNGVQASFMDAAHQRRDIAREVISGVLKALNIPAGNEKEIRESLHSCRLEHHRRGVEPVVVAWKGSRTKVVLSLPARLSKKRAQITFQFEGGRTEKWDAEFCAHKELEVERERFALKEFILPQLPVGYHNAEMNVGDETYRTLVISAPVEGFSECGKGKAWGAFLPMYAAHSKKSWGAGNFSDWEQFSHWLGQQGGGVAATLPLLAAFLDNPVCEPSPYSPASRLFWNEFYLDIERVPEFTQCREAQNLVSSAAFQKELRAFRRAEFIDYSAQWKARRKVLELLAACFFRHNSPRRASFDAFIRRRPEVKDYAAFRAVCDKLKNSWHHWTERLRNGNLRRTDYEESIQRFHLYIQWLADEQLEGLIRRGEQDGVRLYLDLPLGVNPDGYDVWRERESFAMGANAGAPPDLFFSKGQNWGFSPLHPRRIRELGYQYVLRFLRFQMHQARLLRIDHVMGLHRLYWVPHGFEARQGAYVSYPAEELHAIFNIESHRNRTRLVGENLGTVPPTVNESMTRHRMRGMFVVQFEERPDPKAALPAPPTLSVASINTHDTPAFAAHWRGEDLLESVRLGLMRRNELKNAKKYRGQLKASVVGFLQKQKFLKTRKPNAREVLQALLAWLRTGKAELTLVTMEDLWLEMRPQNVPGTSSERPNWRRKAKLSLDQIVNDARLRKLIPR